MQSRSGVRQADPIRPAREGAVTKTRNMYKAVSSTNDAS